MSFSNFVSLFLFLSITLPIIDSFVKLRVHFCLAYLFTSLGLRNPRFLSPAYCLSTTLYLLLRSCCQVSGILQIQDSIRRIFKAWCSRSILDLVLFLSRVITLTILGWVEKVRPITLIFSSFLEWNEYTKYLGRSLRWMKSTRAAVNLRLFLVFMLWFCSWLLVLCFDLNLISV